MTKTLTVIDVPPARLERLMQVGQIVDENALKYMADKMGPDSPPGQLQAKIEELSLPHLTPIVVYDTEEDSLVLMWGHEEDGDDKPEVSSS